MQKKKKKIALGSNYKLYCYLLLFSTISTKPSNAKSFMKYSNCIWDTHKSWASMEYH